jgi:hypothetical protein
MTDMTLSAEYNEVWTAFESGLTPGEFRLLPYDEQAELTAYWYVNSRIKSFYAEEQRSEAERKRQEMEAAANARRHTRQ